MVVTGGSDEVAPRLRRRLLVAAGAVASVLVVTSAVGLALADSPTLGAPAFAVSSGPGEVRVTIVDTTAGAAQMTAQLAAAGLGVTVQTRPVSPQLVGTWVGVGGEPDTDERVYEDVTAQALGYTDDLVVPADVTGLTLSVGVEPEPGQEPHSLGFRNAFAPGGALECSAARGATLTEASALLQAQGYRIETVSFGTLNPADAADDDIVTTVFHTDETPRDLMLVALPAGDDRLQPLLDHGFSARQAAVDDCP